MNILITGGLGFIGTNLANYLILKKHNIICIDNLLRKENKRNLNYLNKKCNVYIKSTSFIKNLKNIDLIIHLASDPSVMSGVTYKSNLVKSNIQTTLDCLELCKLNKIPIIFFSSSRIYPINTINKFKYKIVEKRFVLESKNKGITYKSFNDDLDINGVKSLYGFSKFSSEELIKEYASLFGVKFIVNRFGLVSGFLQNGHKNQGILSFMLKKWIENKEFKVIGYGGNQVRDVLNVEDLCILIDKQIENIFDKNFSNQTFNVGGGLNFSYSINEIIDVLNKKYFIKKEVPLIDNERIVDIKYYVSDNRKVSSAYNWKPKKDIVETISDIERGII